MNGTSGLPSKTRYGFHSPHMALAIAVQGHRPLVIPREASQEEQRPGDWCSVELLASNTHCTWGTREWPEKGIRVCTNVSTVPHRALGWYVVCEGNILDLCQPSFSFFSTTASCTQIVQGWFYLSCLIRTLGTDLRLLLARS